VLWHLDTGRPGPSSSKQSRTAEYGKKLEAQGKLECRYHLIGRHGGAWIYNVKSNEELDLLLAMAPVYNYAIMRCFRWRYVRPGDGVRKNEVTPGLPRLDRISQWHLLSARPAPWNKRSMAPSRRNPVDLVTNFMHFIRESEPRRNKPATT